MLHTERTCPYWYHISRAMHQPCMCKPALVHLKFLFCRPVSLESMFHNGDHDRYKLYETPQAHQSTDMVCFRHCCIRAGCGGRQMTQNAEMLLLSLPFFVVIWPGSPSGHSCLLTALCPTECGPHHLTLFRQRRWLSARTHLMHRGAKAKAKKAKKQKVLVVAGFQC